MMFYISFLLILRSKARMSQLSDSSSSSPDDMDTFCPVAEFARFCSMRGADQMTALYRRGTEITSEHVELFFRTVADDLVMLRVLCALRLPRRTFDLAGTWSAEVDEQRRLVTIFIDGDLLCQRVAQPRRRDTAINMRQ